MTRLIALMLTITLAQCAPVPAIAVDDVLEKPIPLPPDIAAVCKQEGGCRIVSNDWLKAVLKEALGRTCGRHSV